MSRLSSLRPFHYNLRNELPWITYVRADRMVQIHTTSIWQCTDKSLARQTSRCRRTESIVSLERGVCSCAELQVPSGYRGWKEACQAKRAISTTSRRELSSSFFFKGKAPKEIHAILLKALGEHAPSYATVKNWVAQFKRGNFSTCDAPRPGRTKTS